MFVVLYLQIWHHTHTYDFLTLQLNMNYWNMVPMQYLIEKNTTHSVKDYWIGGLQCWESRTWWYRKRVQFQKRLENGVKLSGGRIIPETGGSENGCLVGSWLMASQTTEPCNQPSFWHVLWFVDSIIIVQDVIRVTLSIQKSEIVIITRKKSPGVERSCISTV